MSTTIKETKIGKSPSQQRSLFDKFVLVVAIVEPFTTAPQLYEVWVRKQFAGVSVSTWLLYSLADCVWVAYAVKQKDRQVFIGSVLWGLMEFSVALGVLLRK